MHTCILCYMQWHTNTQNISIRFIFYVTMQICKIYTCMIYSVGLFPIPNCFVGFLV